MYIRLSKPAIGTEELKAIEEVLDSGWIATGGGKIEEFEEKIKEYLKVDYAVAVSSGTAALHLSLLSLPKKPKAVIIPDFTFPATGNVVELARAKPILVDVKMSDFNIDMDDVEKHLMISNNKRVIMPVSEFGQACDLDRLCELSERYDVPIIEDSACSLGAKYRGKMVGTFGCAAAFSFHATKGITTGEGGVLVTNDEKIAERARMLRNHGKDSEGRFVEHGYNYRLNEISAAIGVAQMSKIDNLIGARRGMATYYDSKLVNLDGVQVPVEKEGCYHIYQRYIIVLNKIAPIQALIKRMKAQGVETAIGTWCLSEQPAFEEWQGLNPTAKYLYEQSLALPLYPDLKKEQQDYVIEKLGEVLK